MKVLLINGDFSQNGCTQFGLEEISNKLNELSVHTTIYQLKEKVTEAKDYFSLFDVAANEVAEMMREYDGLVVGGAVVNCGINGELKSFMDKLFEVCPKSRFAFKPASAFVTTRRGGATAAHSTLDMYFMMSHMTIVSSSYWTLIHGTTPEECAQDKESMESLENVAINMAYYLKMRECANENNVLEPIHETEIFTDYVREDSYYKES